MLDSYSVLIKRKENSDIDFYYYPDFDYTYVPSADMHISEYDCASILVSHIQHLKIRHKAIPFPQSLRKSQLSIPKSLLDQWSVCFIESKLIAGFWESTLPRLGVFSSFMTAVTMGIINFLTIKTSVSSKEGTSLGIIGAMYGGLMALILYYFSNASDFSRQVGRYIDNYLSALAPLNSDTPASSQSNWLSHLLKSLLTTIPVFTTFVNSYTHFKQVGAIGNNLDESDVISQETFNAINIVMIVFSVYSTFFFQISFLPSLYSAIDERYKDSSPTLKDNKSSLFSHDYDRDKQGSVPQDKTDEKNSSLISMTLSNGSDGE